MHDKADPDFGIAAMLAPMRFLQVGALGVELAFDAALLCDVLELADAHAPVRLGRGLAMVHEGRIIPLVDYRSPAGKGGALGGAALVVAKVQHARFALAVDRIGDEIKVDYAEIRLPEPALADRCPYLAGCIWRAEGEVYLVDLERLLGPAIRTHLTGMQDA